MFDDRHSAKMDTEKVKRTHICSKPSRDRDLTLLSKYKIEFPCSWQLVVKSQMALAWKYDFPSMRYLSQRQVDWPLR